MTTLSWFEDYGQDNYKGYDLKALAIDEAYLTLGEGTDTVSLFAKHKECLKCPFLTVDDEDDRTTPNITYILRKVPQYIYRLYGIPEGNVVCELKDKFGEFGIYQLNINNGTDCDVQVVKEPVSIAFPVLTVFLLYLAIFLGVFALAFLWQKIYKKEKGEKDENTTKPNRVRSLDTFRGISIVIMIFVNFGAGQYEILDHAIWNGLHLADLVFPWFMWIMGVCIPISLSSSFKRKTPNIDIFKNILKRSVKLFCLGIFLGGGTVLDHLRIFGVLQRFGICYFVVTTICIYLLQRDFSVSEHKIWGYFSDISKLLLGWIIIGAIFVLHCIITFMVADDGCRKGYLGPGGLHDSGKHYNCTGGATGYIDKIILGDHRYPYPTIGEVYEVHGAFDPEGILGCLTSIIHVFIGVQAGVTLMVYKEHTSRLIRWLSWGVITGLIGGALCGFSKDDGVIPVNKNLWSISFVMITCCFAFVLLSICYVIIDIKHWWSGKPFLFAGMNAILMYIGHSMVNNFPARWQVTPEGHKTHFIALFENLWGTGFWVLVSYYLYKIKYFFTI